MAKLFTIHALESRSPHVPAHGKRSGLRHFVTCKICLRTHYPNVTREIQIQPARRTRTRDRVAS